MFTGKLGGPVADVAALIGEVVGVERVPITFTVQQGKGTLIIGQRVQAELVPNGEGHHSSGERLSDHCRLPGLCEPR